MAPNSNLTRPLNGMTWLVCGERPVTVVVEIGWTQELGPSSAGNYILLGKAKEDWIDIGVCLVLLVKLYGYKKESVAAC